MMTKCPECGSTEIIPDLHVFTKRAAVATNEVNYVVLEDPTRKGKPVDIGFRAAICGNCGHVEFFVRYAAELLDAHKRGYVSR
jgi:predicted nucleic-acid-binding Zn-ribbon protein